MQKRSQKYLTWIVVAVVLVVAVGLLVSSRYVPGENDALAQCLTEKGTKYYGAFWCPNCQAQNRLFGNSKRLLNYIECSTPDGKGQLEVCRTAGITGYPTWEFADGSRETGVQTLEKLAEKASCNEGSVGTTSPSVSSSTSSSTSS